MDKEILLNVLKQKNAKEGQPDEWLSLKEIHTKVGYKIPYSRWAKLSLKKHGIQPKVIDKKHPGRGRPFRLYYIPVDNSDSLLGAVERKRHVSFTLVRKK
jgi:predicted transcriptional regulator